MWEWDESDEYPVTSGGAEWFSARQMERERAETDSGDSLFTFITALFVKCRVL